MVVGMDGLHIEMEAEEYNLKIQDQIKKQVDRGRPVLVFFASEDALDEWKRWLAASDHPDAFENIHTVKTGSGTDHQSIVDQAIKRACDPGERHQGVPCGQRRRRCRLVI